MTSRRSTGPTARGRWTSGQVGLGGGARDCYGALPSERVSSAPRPDGPLRGKDAVDEHGERGREEETGR